jgi:hypothetical protein
MSEGASRAFFFPVWSTLSLLAKFHPKSEFQNFKKDVILEVFSHQKWEINLKLKITRFIYLGSLCSQKYRRRIKDLHFVSDL